MKLITIRRDPGFYGSMRKLTILIDGTKVARLKQYEDVLLEVDDEAIHLQGIMDWGKTEHVSLRDLDHGATITFKAWFTLNPLRNLGISPLPFRVTIQK
ncbi:hypothetical protein [Thalassobius sp. I31.1]|uniref:hypothetical protein n=1 Tax=Thalassobius sp. I31.1 TaxID=2109912 RepID=UPI000D1ADC80|nr:hypothetical protein [Thalassobius sp. I31.1]